MRLFSTYITGALALAAAGMTIPADAMPANGVSATPLPLATSVQPDVTLVSGGCGPYRHRGPNGFCYPNRGGYRPYGGYGYRPYGYGGGYGYGHPHFFRPF